jgi:hypothetical protein
MTILEEDSPNSMLFEQDGPPPYFHSEVMGFLYPKFPGKWTGKGRPATLFAPFYSSQVFLLGYIGCCVRYHQWLPLCQNFLRG